MLNATDLILRATLCAGYRSLITYKPVTCGAVPNSCADQPNIPHGRRTAARMRQAAKPFRVCEAAHPTLKKSEKIMLHHKTGRRP